MPITLVLADDHPLILEGMENIFSDEQDFKVLARCPDGEKALKAVRKHKPDILVLDIRMPGNGKLEVLQALKAESHSTRVILLTAAIDNHMLADAIRLGARGVVLKELAPSLLVQCVRRVHAGELWLEKHSVTGALEALLRAEAKKSEAVTLLTQREVEIIKQVSSGLHNLDIAKRLFISEGTVKNHLHNIFQKLELDSRTKLVRFARENGLLSLLPYLPLYFVPPIA